MKFTLIVATFFFLSFSGWAGTFLETFDDKNLKGWGELWADKGPAVPSPVIASRTVGTSP